MTTQCTIEAGTGLSGAPRDCINACSTITAPGYRPAGGQALAREMDARAAGAAPEPTTRKRLTALLAEHSSSGVPVYVLAATAADTAAETIDRIVHQIVTNDQKQDLSNAQRARGIQQMIDAGLLVQKAAKILRTKTARSGARVRRKRLTRGGLPLERAGPGR